MQPRCKRLSLLLTLCILLSVFTAFPTVSAVSVQPPADAAGAAAVTYEDVLALSPERIVQADYRVVSDVRCIYAETAEDAWGYAQRYWVSVDTGLLVVAERLQKGETVYRMAALEADQTAPPAETFTLPDGTDLLHR